MEPHRQDFTAKGAPRKRKPWGSGPDPLVAVRVPQAIIQLARARAAERGVNVPTIVREALSAYVRNFEGRAA